MEKLIDIPAFKPFRLYDENDPYFLDLTPRERGFIPREWSDLSFSSPEFALESAILYSYKNFGFAAKMFLNIDLLPYQVCTLEQLYYHQFPMLIASRGYSKSFLLSVYALLRAILMQGSRVALISSSFRQSKTMFNYINDIYKKSSFLQQICGREYPKFDISACRFKVGDSTIVALPLGDGQKIRGERANCVDGNTLIATNKGVIKIKDCQSYMNDPTFMVHTGAGTLRKPAYFMKTKPIKSYLLEFENGQNLICSYLHAIHLVNNEIREAKELSKNDRAPMFDKNGSLVGGSNIKNIRLLEKELELYDFTIPEEHSFIGNGIKNRNCIISDEFASISEEIFQVVVRGFGAVSLDPVQKVKENYRLEALKKSGVDISGFKQRTKNQIVIGGTAYYQFNHFYQWYERYKKIISCNNDKDQLRDIMGEEASDEDLKHLDTREFCIMKVPHTHTPILEESMIAQAKATMSSAQFAMEYGAEFYADSEGFIPRSLIETTSLIEKFSPLVFGKKDKRYIMGVDPARKRDHFSIVIIEVDDTQTKRHKVVYCWATNEKKMKKSGEVNENQTYYGACAKKIRQLMKRFNIVLISMDTGGGGDSIAEILREKTHLVAGEKQIWEIDNPDHRMYDGLHLVKLVASSPSWASLANHSFRKSIEDFRLLFPVFDTAEIEKDMSTNPDLYSDEFMNKIVNKSKSFMVDSLESVSEEIERLKEEVSSIVITTTAGNNEHFDLPKLAAPGQAKTEDRRRKDRYSACLLAHFGLSEICVEDVSSSYRSVGGTAKSSSGKGNSGNMYKGLPAGTKAVYTGRICSINKRNGGIIGF